MLDDIYKCRHHTVCSALTDWRWYRSKKCSITLEMFEHFVSRGFMGMDRESFWKMNIYSMPLTSLTLCLLPLLCATLNGPKVASEILKCAATCLVEVLCLVYYWDQSCSNHNAFLDTALKIFRSENGVSEKHSSSIPVFQGDILRLGS